MKKIKIIMVMFVILAGLYSGVYAIPDAFNYQARIYSPPGSGTPIPDSPGNTISVSIYNVSTGGAPLWSTTVFPPSNGGLVSFEISGFGALLDFLNDYWLGFSVNGDPEMTPRQKLLSAPYAGRAQFVNEVNEYTKLIGPLSVTATSNPDAGFSVTNTAGTAIMAYGVTAVSAITSDINGLGLLVDSSLGGRTMIVKGGDFARFEGPGILVDSGAYPAALYVSFTAGAWPAVLITAPNGQAMQIYGSGGGMGNAIVDVRGNTIFGNVTAISGFGSGFGYAGVSGTAVNGGTGISGQGTIGVVGKGITGVAGVSNSPTGYGVYAENTDFNGYALLSKGKSYFYGSVTIEAIDPFMASLNVFNNAGTGQAIYANNPPGVAVLGNGVTGLRGEGTSIGVEGFALNGNGVAVSAINDNGSGSFGGAALSVLGKLKIGSAASVDSPLGAAQVPVGNNPSISVNNNLCDGGAYRVLVTPVSSPTAAGNPVSWWVEKQDGHFVIHVESGGAMIDAAIDFDYLIINN